MKRLVDILQEQARFAFYRDGSLYYETDSRFVFSIPVSETGTATYNASEKAIVFMKWIRPQYTGMVAEQTQRKSPSFLGCPLPENNVPAEPKP